MASKPETLPGIRASAAIDAAYQKQLDRLIAEMHKSLQYWLAAAFKAKPPEMAGDMSLRDLKEAAQRKYEGSPAMVMQRVMRALTRRWTKRFNDAAPKLAEYFSTEIALRNDRTLQAALRKGGISVRLKMTAQMNDVLRATMNEQVGLIKSIAQQHLSEVEGLVMRSVQRGGDLSELSKQLEARYGVTKRRASLIARDQNQKATATLQRVRQLELGIKTALWKHSHAGAVPRASHVAMDGKEYDIAKGMWDPDADGKGKGRFIQPGELINCRCFSKPVIEALLKREPEKLAA